MKKLPPKHMRDFKHQLTTRRDFLSAGLVSFGAAVAVPSFVTQLGKPKPKFNLNPACGESIFDATATPFLAFDLAGGLSLPGNFLVGKRGGPMDFLPSYRTLGFDPRAAGALNTEFGLPMSATYSKMLTGILANTTPEARAKLRMGSICHVAEFDTSSNPLNSGTLVLKAGARGTFITNGAGQRGTNSGGNSAAAQESAAYKPIQVQSVSDVLSSINFGGVGFTGATVSQLRALAEGSVNLASLQKEMYANRPGGGDLAEASDCAYSKSLDFLSGVEGLDPRLDANARTVYEISEDTQPADMNAVAAALAMNTIKGYAGPSTFTIGGCDYHDGGFMTGDAKDQEVGVLIGRAVQYAHLSGKPLFFQLLTDGGNSSRPGERNWASDSKERCMTVMGYYNPTSTPQYINDRMQIGHYTDGEGAATTTLIGNSPLLAAYAVFANYLNVSGRLSEFSLYAPGVFAGAGELDSVLVFEGPR